MTASALDMGRDIYRTIRLALLVLVNIQQAFDVTAIAQHVRMEDKIIAECISWGRYVSAKQHTEK